MKYASLKKIATTLLIILFLMPLLVGVVSYLLASTTDKNITVFQVIFMGIYNLPFLLAAVIGLAAGSTFDTKLKEKAANISLILSICSSVIGIAVMIAWGVGGL